MKIEMVQDILFWSFMINLGILLYWFIFFSLAHDFIYRLHGRWFKISRQQFDAIHYGAMAFFKLSVFLFNLVPYLAMRIVT